MKNILKEQYQYQQNQISTYRDGVDDSPSKERLLIVEDVESRPTEGGVGVVYDDMSELMLCGGSDFIKDRA